MKKKLNKKKSEFKDFENSQSICIVLNKGMAEQQFNKETISVKHRTVSHLSRKTTSLN